MSSRLIEERSAPPDGHDGPALLLAPTLGDAMKAESGMTPPPRDFPRHMMSGTTPYGSSADQVPVRPAPVSTSSEYTARWQGVQPCPRRQSWTSRPFRYSWETNGFAPSDSWFQAPGGTAASPSSVRIESCCDNWHIPVAWRADQGRPTDFNAHGR